MTCRSGPPTPACAAALLLAEEASTIGRLLDLQRRAIETHGLELRLQELEAEYKGQPQAQQTAA